MRRTNKDLFAFALIAIGVITIFQIFDVPFLRNFNLGNLIGVVWPLFLLIPGLNMLKNKFDLGGIILTLIGGAFLTENVLELFNINFEGNIIFKFFWPAILIFIGYKLLSSDKKVTFKGDDKFEGTYNSSESTRSTAINFSSKTFIYEDINMAPGITQLPLNISFGGAEIYVEEGIQVILVGQYTLGGHEFFGQDAGGFHSEIREIRYPELDESYYEKTLVIKANISFGGLEVRKR